MKKIKKILFNPTVFLVMGISGSLFYLINHFYIRTQSTYYFYPTYRMDICNIMDIWFLTIFIVYVSYSLLLKYPRTKKNIHHHKRFFITFSILLFIAFILSTSFFIIFFASVYMYLFKPGSLPPAIPYYGKTPSK